MTAFLHTLYLFLPAYVANAAPVLLTNIPLIKRYNMPIWETGFGKNKTRAGFIGGTLSGMATSAAQYGLQTWDAVPFLPSDLYETLPISLLVGFLLGAGALVGDSAKSFIKRRIGIRPGGPLPFWDGTDHILGALLFLAPFYIPPFWQCIALILISPVLSLAANTFSYCIGWKKVWY